MKIRLTFKSPDAVSEGLADAGMNPWLPEYDELYSELAEFIRYGEYIDVEYDTETKQMSVVRKK